VLINTKQDELEAEMPGVAADLQDAIARELVTMAEGEYRDFHRPFVEKCTNIYYAYMGVDRAEDSPKEDWRSRVYPKYVKCKVLAAWSQMVQSLMNMNDPFNVEPNKGESNVDGAKAMKQEILEQQDRADFAEKQKISLMDLNMYGNCCFQAPMPVEREKKNWVVDAKATLLSVLAMKPTRVYKPVYQKSIDPVMMNRNIMEMMPFPYAADIQGGEGVFHNPVLSKYELTELSQRPDFDQALIKEALRVGPTNVEKQDGLKEKLAARGFTSSKGRNGWDYLFYSGKFDVEKLVKAGFQDFSDMKGYLEILAHVVKSSDKPRLIKIAKNPMANKRRPFHWAIYERVPYEVRGVGIGENVLDLSDIGVGAVRMFIDAKKLALPMIAIDASQSHRFPGSTFEMRPFKTFLFNGDPNKIIKEFQFQDVSDGMMSLIELAERLMDEISGMPKFTTGVDSRMINKTASGLGMLINAQGQLMRGAYENYEDNIIEPIAEAFYDWNMEFNPNNSIKGDYRISANGLSAQMVKDTMNGQLFQLMSYIINPAVTSNPYALKLLRMVGDNIGIKDVDGAIPNPDKLRTMANNLRSDQPAPEAAMVSAPPGVAPSPGAAAPSTGGMPA
jgi:hypothetical protein